jgi:hypothetical protein
MFLIKIFNLNLFTCINFKMLYAAQIMMLLKLFVVFCCCPGICLVIVVPRPAGYLFYGQSSSPASTDAVVCCIFCLLLFRLLLLSGCLPRPKFSLLISLGQSRQLFLSVSRRRLPGGVCPFCRLAAAKFAGNQPTNPQNRRPTPFGCLVG